MLPWSHKEERKAHTRKTKLVIYLCSYRVSVHCVLCMIHSGLHRLSCVILYVARTYLVGIYIESTTAPKPTIQTRCHIITAHVLAFLSSPPPYIHLSCFNSLPSPHQYFACFYAKLWNQIISSFRLTRARMVHDFPNGTMVCANGDTTHWLAEEGV